MRIIPTHIDSVKKQIDTWEIKGIIIQSKSEYASQLVILK